MATARPKSIVGDAIAGRRDGLFIVSKVLPENSSRKDTIAACEGSLKRLRTDRIDLYLLHWRGSTPLQHTLDAFSSFSARARSATGASAISTPTTWRNCWRCPAAMACATNQVLYNLKRRRIEYDLVPLCRARNIPVMAYSPIEQGRLLGAAALKEVASRHEATTAQVALAWLLRQARHHRDPEGDEPGACAREFRALDLKLTDDDLTVLDRAFPPPHKKYALEML